MGYELAITIKGGWVEVEADTPRALERRVAALDLRALEAAVRKARAGPRGGKKRARARRP